MPDLTLDAGENGVRLDLWLAGHMDGYSRSFVQKLLDDGCVTVDGAPAKRSRKLRAGERVTVKVPEPVHLDVEAEDIAIDILYEDNDIIVINKPKGMVVHPAAGNKTGTLVNALLKHCGSGLSDINGVIRPGIVHRLDRDTTGVLVAAKNNETHEALSARLAVHDMTREYVAVVTGVIKEERGRIDAPIGRHPADRKKMAVNTKNGRHAVTCFTVIERLNGAAFVRLRLETGRTHQIRVHMAYIKHPVLGDEVYGKKDARFETHGQALHAELLGFVHPRTGEYVEFRARIPEYMENIINDLRNNNVLPY